MIEEKPVGQKALEKSAASSQMDKQEILSQPHLEEVRANEAQRNLMQEHEQRFEKLSENEFIQTLFRSR